MTNKIHFKNLKSSRYFQPCFGKSFFVTRFHTLSFQFRFSPLLCSCTVLRNVDISYETSPRGNPILVLNYNRYVRNRESKKRVFWRCTKYYQNQINCPGSVAITKPDESGTLTINTTRSHNGLCELKREQDEQESRSRTQRSRMPPVTVIISNDTKLGKTA